MSHKRKLSAYIIAFIYALFLITAICGANAYGEISQGTAKDIYGGIDEYLERCVKNANIPALSVSIVDKDKTLFSGNYGECESGDTPFVLGSVSKSFTAICVMKLAESKKIDLNAAVSEYLPYVKDGDKIKVCQLLNHTGGLGEHQTLENCEIVNAQGAHYYSNVNYTLLGKIIETVSGKSYAEYVTENLFEPLKLARTAVSYDKSMQNGLIDGYADYWGVHVKTPHKYPSSENAWLTEPAAYISSSARDLGRYLQMYLNGGQGVISEESIHTMFYGDTVYVEGDIPFWYGYGWAMVKEPLPEPVLRHSGLVETGTSCVFILPERNIGVAIECNVNDYFVTNEMMDSLGWGIILMILGRTPNEISGGEYFIKHILIDLIMLAVLIFAVVPWLLLKRYAERIKRVKMIPIIAELAIFHCIAPALILSAAPLFFSTPLWVVKDFVPDVFITVVISSALLFISGIAKAAMLYMEKSGG